MLWYAVYYKNTGELYSIGTVIEPEKLAKNLDYIELPKQPDFAVEEWSQGELTMKARPIVEVALPVTLDSRIPLIESELSDIKGLLQESLLLLKGGK